MTYIPYSPPRPRNLPLSIYIHVPFCRFKCFYCDFNTYAGIEKLIPDYVAALTIEIRRWQNALERAGIRPRIETIFFGGGTPSLLPPAQLEKILRAFVSTLNFRRDIEISMEVNPESVTPGFARDVMSLGVNRFSMGAQSFNPAELRMLGRLHDETGVERAMNALRAAGARNVNLDLMYGLPRQTLKTWESSLSSALALRPDHLSLYALTVEESTPFHGWVESGRLPSPDPDLAADMYELAESRLAQTRLEQYEISNWARLGQQCRHNLAYWLNAPFLGYGPGAHSHMFGARFSIIRQPRAYIDRMVELVKQPLPESPPLPSLAHVAEIDQNAPFNEMDALGQTPSIYYEAALRQIAPIDAIDPYTGSMRQAETLVLGLRLNRGVNEQDYAKRFGATPTELFGPAIEQSIADGLLERIDPRPTGYAFRPADPDTPRGRENAARGKRDALTLRLTPRGRLLSNEVFLRIMTTP